MEKIFFRITVLTFLFTCLSLTAEDTRPRNVILVIGDGMGYDHLLSGRIHKGNIDAPLAMEQLPISGNLSTFAIGVDRITDSAASATAMATGCKTENGRISTLPDGSEIPTLYENLKARHYRLGIVTNGSINGATAAAFTTHADNRDEKEKISRQLVELKLDFLLGTSDELFYLNSPEPITEATMTQSGWDVFIDQNLEDVILGSAPVCIGYTVMIDEAASIHQQKNVYGDNVPTLRAAFELSIQKLSEGNRGFFLMLEEDWIDSWGHENEFALIGNSVSDLDDAVRSILKFAEKDGETLVIVTADHECGGLTIPVLSSERIEHHFSTKEHTASTVPLFAYGPGSHYFSGSLDNTDIYLIISRLLQIQ